LRKRHVNTACSSHARNSLRIAQLFGTARLIKPLYALASAAERHLAS
jgi:hypothetical protein